MEARAARTRHGRAVVVGIWLVSREYGEAEIPFPGCHAGQPEAPDAVDVKNADIEGGSRAVCGDGRILGEADESRRECRREGQRVVGLRRRPERTCETERGQGNCVKKEKKEEGDGMNYRYTEAAE